MKKTGVMLLWIAVLSLPACGGNGGDQETTTEARSTPTVESSPYEAPKPDTVPLAKAKRGDLIALPFYPGVGKYGGTADLRGMKTFEMKMALLDRNRVFAPSVLIGSPGQKIKLTGFDAPNPGVATVSHHDFRISDTEEFSFDHEILSDWKERKGTEFTLTFPEEGKVSFYCKYHLHLDMAGMLIVRG